MACRLVPASSLLLGGAAAAAVGAALFADVVVRDHPTHSAVLGLVTVVVAALRRLARPVATVSAAAATSAALAVQPVLHRFSELTAVHGDHADPVHHLVLSVVPTAGVQIAVPALLLVAVLVGAHLLHLLLDALRHPLAPPHVPAAPQLTRLPCARRRGSMLHWCGWAIRSARRGPPRRPGYVAS